jgi:cardiolipin synthase A/B
MRWCGLKGPVTAQFELTFLFDWSVDNPAVSQLQRPSPDARSRAMVKPWPKNSPLARCIGTISCIKCCLSAILDAREELVITTPYFGPDDGLLQASDGSVAPRRQGDFNRA